MPLDECGPFPNSDYVALKVDTVPEAADGMGKCPAPESEHFPTKMEDDPRALPAATRTVLGKPLEMLEIRAAAGCRCLDLNVDQVSSFPLR